jgi:hypothetical protein
MATEIAIAMRRARALEEQARQTAELNRKLDLIMEKLGIQDTQQADQAASETAAPTNEIEAKPNRKK